MAKTNGTSPARKCVECGQRLSGRGRRLYCSQECALIDRICAYCGKVDRIPRKRRHRLYCSQRCAKAANGLKSRVAMVAMECQFCGCIFEVYPSQATPRRKFCSKTCAGLGRPINGKPSKIATAAIEVFLSGYTGRAEPEKRVGRFSVDLALPDLWLALELDGVYWHSLPEMVEKDERKMGALRSAGWHPISITIHSDSTPESLASEMSEAVASFVRLKEMV